MKLKRLTPAKEKKRKTICPMCESKLVIKFEEEELFQKGKNIKCPYCNYLLWIPLRGKPHPVPVYIS